MGEAIVLEGGEKRNPPTTYVDLKKTVCTFAGLTFVLYSPACDFYKKLWGICKALRHERVTEMEDKFSSTFCKQIVWAIISDKCNYFSTRLHPDSFKNDLEEPDFPSSGLSTIIPNIRQQEYFHWGSFSEAWKPKPAYGPRDPPSTSLLTQANKNKFQTQKQAWTWHPHPMPNDTPPMFASQQLKQGQDSQRSSGAGGKSWRDQLGHLHPFIKSFMQPFHEAFEGRVMLRRMLDTCGLDNKKLPVMKEYVNPDTKRNNLCYYHVLGICPHGKKCIFVHVPGAEVGNAKCICQ
jgi:hypothetical protein